MTRYNFICGLAGTALSERERCFLADARPCGVILFKRNCETGEQLRALTSSLREIDGDANFPILIDQEGGRVQRLGPPYWRRYPPARLFAVMHGGASEKALAAAYAGARLIAHDLGEVGINVNCAPVLDVPAPGSHDIIGDRAYASEAAAVTAFGRAVAQGFLDGGVLPVIKHIPGHGRAGADSHLSLPRIEATIDELTRIDFVPFKALKDLPVAMTAHVLLTAVDAQRPASASPAVIDGVIRGAIGFDGLLICDDLSMGALSGGLAERTRAVLDAGCDAALHCNGNMTEMEAVASQSAPLSGLALARYEKALSCLGTPKEFDKEHAAALIGETLAETA